MNSEIARKEIIEIMTVGVEKISQAGRINSRDFETEINQLKSYGYNYVDAQNCIIAMYLNS